MFRRGKRYCCPQINGSVTFHFVLSWLGDSELGGSLDTSRRSSSSETGKPREPGSCRTRPAAATGEENEGFSSYFEELGSQLVQRLSGLPHSVHLHQELSSLLLQFHHFQPKLRLSFRSKGLLWNIYMIGKNPWSSVRCLKSSGGDELQTGEGSHRIHRDLCWRIKSLDYHVILHLLLLCWGGSCLRSFCRNICLPAIKGKLVRRFLSFSPWLLLFPPLLSLPAVRRLGREAHSRGRLRPLSPLLGLNISSNYSHNFKIIYQDFKSFAFSLQSLRQL